jgi:hypothetical protein
MFERYIGIDYSGAETANASLKGLRMYLADRDHSPTEVPPPPSPRKYWTRRKGIAQWLVERLAEPVRTLIGIDHAFSFPLQYFERYGLPLDWPHFLEDFSRHWPTDQDHVYVDFVRDGAVGQGAARMGSPRWRWLTDKRARTAKSVFRFDVQGTVAKSTHSGLPWLRFIRRHVGGRVHFWPFDLMGGNCLLVSRSWRRSIPRCGVAVCRPRDVRKINKTPMPSLPGCEEPIARDISPTSFHRS